jgi:hypothetical protein
MSKPPSLPFPPLPLPFLLTLILLSLFAARRNAFSCGGDDSVGPGRRTLELTTAVFWGTI